MMHPIKISLAALVVGCTLFAQTLDERIAGVQKPARLTAEGLTGAGADHLLEHGRRAHFFVLGESHGNRETCTITNWLLSQLKGSGYGAYVTETGPCTTDHLGAIAKADKAPGVFRFVRSNPFSVAFLYWKEEAEAFAKAVELGYAPWGLDQEFVGSARFLLGQLAERAKNAKAKELALSWLERAQKGFRHFAKTGDQSKAFMAVVRPKDWKGFEVAFADEAAGTRRILRELRATQQIYGLYHMGRYYDNNHQRIRLMKSHLAQRLAANPKTKALLKFGSAHAGRGYSPFDQLDVGNHAAEAAVARGGDSFHVMVFARESVQKDGSIKDFTADGGSLAKFFTAGDGSATDVFDLRALRPAMSTAAAKKAHAELHDLVFRFDALVILPKFHRSEPLHPLPGEG